MGDQILKKIALFLAFSSFLLAQNKFNELLWIDEQIEAIKPPRKGTSYRSISLLNNPFVFLEKNRRTQKEKVANSSKPTVVPSSVSLSLNNATEEFKPTKQKGFKLAAILNNAALINNQWHKLGEKVNGCKIVKVTFTEVTLQKGSKNIVLTTYTQKLNNTK